MRLTGPNGAVIEDEGLVDSGADSSAFPLWMMKRFGIRKMDCDKKRFDSAGGRCVQWIYDDDLHAVILGRRFQLTAIFCETPIALLGRTDFFDRFKVQFDERELKFRIEAY